MLTNIYSDEAVNSYGDPLPISYTSGSINDYHIYEIKWLPNQVSWFIDGELIRTDTSNVPAGPMNFNLNMWVPDSGFTLAYSPNLQPTASVNSDERRLG